MRTRTASTVSFKPQLSDLRHGDPKVLRPPEFWDSVAATATATAHCLTTLSGQLVASTWVQSTDCTAMTRSAPNRYCDGTRIGSFLDPQKESRQKPCSGYSMIR